MTERRPAHESVPDFVERQILEAQARGDFDGLRGAGRPLPGLDQPHDELWWIRRKLRDEHVTDLPPALRARRDRELALAEALAADDEATVRRVVEDVNERIRTINRTTWYGPPTGTGPLDVDEVVARWWQDRGAALAAEQAAAAVAAGPAPTATRAAGRWGRVAAAARRCRVRRDDDGSPGRPTGVVAD